MSKKPKPPDAIETTQAKLPTRCPACIQAVTTTRESGAVTRLTCGSCQWTERYKVIG
jgi:ribosomal protein S27AE